MGFTYICPIIRALLTLRPQSVFDDLRQIKTAVHRPGDRREQVYQWRTCQVLLLWQMADGCPDQKCTRLCYTSVPLKSRSCSWRTLPWRLDSRI